MLGFIHLQRSKKSERELFIEIGREEATIREIAHRSDHRAGTIFRYAEDERDLLFLIFKDDHFNITGDAFSETNSIAPLLDQLIDVFRHYFLTSLNSPCSRVMYRAS